jgi:transposase
MLSFAGSLKVFLALEPCDLRKGFEGLQALVSEVLKEELRSGALFVFCNRRRTRLKVLYCGWPPRPLRC